MTNIWQNYRLVMALSTSDVHLTVFLPHPVYYHYTDVRLLTSVACEILICDVV